MKRFALALALLVGTANVAQAQKILVYGPGGTTATSHFPTGATVTTATAAQWAAMTTAQFGAYDALWLDDNNCATTPTIFDTAAANRATWAAAVTGRIHISGADADFHAQFQTVAATYIANSAKWVGGLGNNATGGKTGLFIELGCIAAVRADLLSPFGVFSGAALAANPTVINAPASPLLTGINTVTQLALSSFAYEAFDTYPARFSPLVSSGTRALDLYADAALVISPTTATVAPHTAFTFFSSGGTSPYTYSFVANHSGATLNATTGAYVAGATGSVSDVVQVSDAAGHTASATINVGSAIVVLPAAPSVTPRAPVMFMASGGSGVGFTWTLPTNNSGGSISAAGLYFAGDKGSVSDVVHVVDSLGNVAQVTVTVGPSISISPSPAAAFTGGTVDFSASGGSGTGYTWTLATNVSGATISQTSGVYLAGSVAGVDVVKATDSLGASTTAKVTVSARPQPVLSPPSATTPPRGNQQFTTTGGTAPYAYSMASAPSGGSINASGLYVAGPFGGVTDVVQVTDAAGLSVTAQVLVGPGVSLSPPSASIYPHGTVAFTPSGGSGINLHCAFGSNNSVGTLDGTGSCTYHAGGTGSVTDTIVASDSLGNVATASIAVTAALAMTPPGGSTYPHGTLTFTPSGGSGGYQFSLTGSSGGSITTSGFYTAGGNSGTDLVKLVDSIGDSITATVSVGPTLTVMPSPASTSPRGTIMFMASGGSNGGFGWTLPTNLSGGSIDPVTGIYTAGATASVTDIVHVVDSAGNSLNINVSVGPGVTISPPAPTIAPHGTIGFVAQGGSNKTFTWSAINIASGGSIDPSTGVYHAGAGCNVTDTIGVRDSLNNTAAASITVSACLAVSPTAANTSPHGTVGFVTTGGSGTIASWVVTTNKSGATISSSGVYIAGLTGNSVDVVTATDSNGSTATATVTVSGPLVITPATASTGPRGTQAFAASGGSGTGFTWTLAPNGSGGTIDSLGNYTAGTTPNVTDVVNVTDSVGNTATAKVTVGAALAIAPLKPTVAPRGTQPFTASGGNAPYTWEVTVTTSGSTINGTSGLYTAGTTPGGVDTVCVTDKTASSACTTVTIGAGVTVAPPTATLPPHGTQQFTATGGSGTGFTFAITSNNSNGTISTTGAYVAGPTGSATDTITATDSFGNTGTATVNVTAAVAIKPKKVTLSPGQPQTFTASGGNGSFSFAVTTNNSHATINAGSGAYVAGPIGGVVDTVTVSDSIGGSATAKVTVGAALSITQSSPQTTPPRATIPFSATGGTTPYTWSLTGGSGGTINAGTGVYTAGAVGNSTDVVTVTDAFNNVASVTVAVTAGVTVTPPTASTPPGGPQAFTASGGSNTGFTWSFQTNASGGKVDGNGNYVAGHTGSVADVLVATDSLGNTGTATINVGVAILVAPGPETVPPDTMIDFIAAGGYGSGYTWTLVGTSGGAIGATTGVYKAGTTGNSKDTITVSDPLGNQTSVVITIGSGISITPTSANPIAPLSSISFSATGGSGTGYTWSLAAGPSGGSIGSTSGIYKAGTIGSVIDIVSVSDSLGNVATTNVTIGPAVSITPPTKSLPPLGTFTFAVSGGSGKSYAWSFGSNNSHGTLNSGTGAYQAGIIGDTSDVINVVDSLGNVASATVSVTTGIHVTPLSVNLPPRGTQTFAATGGFGSGYSFTFGTNGSGGSIGGSSGSYMAGNIGSTTDTIVVTDPLGNIGMASVTVGAVVTITPAAPSTSPRGTLDFQATGGSNTGFVWSVSAGLGTGGSGGKIDATGLYTAGSIGPASDVVSVTDSLGNIASVSVSVGAGVSINPANPHLPPHGNQQFMAQGGTGSDYTWVLASAPSGGGINPSTGAYFAGPNGNTTDVVVATDPVGNTATTNAFITAGLSITPASASLFPLGKQTFSVTGGSGGGYTWSLTDNASQGSIDANLGTYVAGPIGGVSDTVTVMDSLGNELDAVVTVGPALAFVPAAAISPPRGHLPLQAQGGAGGNVYSFAQVGSGSGASVNPTTGDYVAGSIGSTTDVVRVTDANGATALFTVTVGPVVSLSPAAPSSPPRGSLTFTAVGGSGVGFVFSIGNHPSGGSIDATGHYTAGAIGNVTDVVNVIDSLGNTASVNVSVGNGIGINPAAPSTPPLGSLTLIASGGSGGNYTWSLGTNASGGSINATNGSYLAGTTGNVTDIVNVIDNLGNTASVNVTVTAGVTATPMVANVAPLGGATFSVSGGSGTGYHWLFITNNSGATINKQTGAYVAGSIGGVTDFLAVADSLGNRATPTVVVGPMLTLTPAAAAAPPHGSVTFTASGGLGGYVFSLAANGSGGSVAQSGLYTAGGMGNATDRVQVVDSNGAIAIARVSVGAGISIVPNAATAVAKESIAFLATGGSGSGYVWTLSPNNSKGTIDASSGIYTAGKKVNVTDIVQVTDPLGNTASADVVVGTGVTLAPVNPTVPPRGSIAFQSTGGSGAYSWRFVTNASGASVNANGGYTAGLIGSVNDVIEVTDAVGDEASTTISVGPAISVTPLSPMVASGRTIHFQVGGGSGTGYVWSILTAGSTSTIDPSSGTYIAGTSGTTDTVQVIDSLGNTALVSVGINANAKPAASKLALARHQQQQQALLAAQQVTAARANAATAAKAAGCQTGGPGTPNGGSFTLFALAAAIFIRRRRALR